MIATALATTKPAIDGRPGEPSVSRPLPEAVGPETGRQTPRELLDSDLWLDPADSDFTATGLRVAFTLRLHRVMTVSTSLLRRELGSPSPRVRALATAKLRSLFSL